MAPQNKLVLVVPAHNEASVIASTVLSLVATLSQHYQYPWELVIAENASTDDTKKIGAHLAATIPHVILLTSEVAGKGRAIRDAWTQRDGDIYGFVDADNSVDCDDALPKIMPAFAEGADIVAASRRLKTSAVSRPLYRRCISQCYSILVRLFVGTSLTDTACGCKFVTRRVVKDLVPHIKNNQWFFDSELVLTAERKKYSLKEIGVRWAEYEYPDRRRIPFTRIAWQYFRELSRLRRRLPARN